jgi:poly-gamma-glutamate capsule biosynthesis protein CapA/YwtB (metallophosphatase superfamily)
MYNSRSRLNGVAMNHHDVDLFLFGDVMLCRGVDQVRARPGDPTLRERFVDDARTYVELAERANGPIPRPVDVTWPWGDALAVLDTATPDVRVLNLETSITRSDAFEPHKDVHYRMHPGNLDGLLAVRPDVCVLANNHVLDFGQPGLLETLDVLSGAGVVTAGAGRTRERAWRPAVVDLDRGGRLLVMAVGMESSGIPAAWMATDDRAGVALLPDSPDAAVEALLAEVQRHRQPGDVVMVSFHWGSNWGYQVPRSQVRVGHALIDGGVDLVHGHSSHHPRPIEVYRDRLILYGCGDLINDYEGITGHEQYRSDLRLLYLASIDSDSGALRNLTIAPMRARRMRLEHASHADVDWLQQTLDRISQPFGVRVEHRPDGTLRLAGT